MPEEKTPSARNGTEAPGGRLSAARSVRRPPGGSAVRKHIAWASATLAMVLITACGSSSPTASATPSPTCVNPGMAHHAYVVVEHLSGASIQRCVGFTGDSIEGKSLMDQSGIKYETQTFSFGLGVCAVDNEPAQFSQCFPSGQPYWALFVEHSGVWAAAQTGFDQIALHDKDALGWRYVPAADATPSPPPPAKES
jgi:hypothetical protein